MTRHHSSPLPGGARRRLPLVAVLLGCGCLVGARFASGPQRSVRPIGPGVRLLQWSMPDGPQQLAAVEADAANPYIRLGISIGSGSSLSLVPLSRQAEQLTRADRYPIAGVNGDYFFYPDRSQPGIPTNAAVLDGEVVRTPFSRSCLLLHPDRAPEIRIVKAAGTVSLPGGGSAHLTGVNQPRAAGQLVLYTPRFGSTTRTPPIGAEALLEPEQFPLHFGHPQRVRVRSVQANGGGSPIPAGQWILSGSGAAAAAIRALHPDDHLELRIDFDPAVAPDDQLLGGGPRIVRDGRVSVEAEGGTLGEAFARARHPRTAVGFNGRKLYLLVVDGRQPGYSAGMTLPELSQAMVDLGCTDAMNLDGGGSTTLWARGAVINRPSDGRERPVADGLLVFSTAPHGDPARLLITPPEIAALPGAVIPVRVSAEDGYFNPVPLPGAVQWSVPDTLGRQEGGKLLVAGPSGQDGDRPRTATARVASGGVSAELAVTVYPKPARVEVLPAALRLGTESQSQFHVRAYDEQGRLLALPQQLQWSAEGGIGAVDGIGNLKAGEQPARGTVTATISGVAGSARVEVSRVASRPLDDFEGTRTWKLRVTPETVSGSVSVVDGPAHSGHRALQVSYDFGTGSGTRVVAAMTELPLGRPFALKAWVYGDGQGEWLRARVRDARGEAHVLDLARHVDWSNSWRELRTAISDDFPTPLTLEALYVVEPDKKRTPKGTLLIDDVGVEQ